MDSYISISSIFQRIVKKEAVTLLIALLIFTALFFVLFVVHFSKELYIEYYDTKRAYLPAYIIQTPYSYEKLKTQIQNHQIPESDYLIASVKTLPKAQAFISSSQASILPKGYTLLALHFDRKLSLDLECKDKEVKVDVRSVYANRKGGWQFKTQPLDECKKHRDLFLLTPYGKIHLINKRTTSRYTKLVYKAKKEDVERFYSFLISLAKQHFLGYNPADRYTLASKDIHPVVALHTKMLKDIFSLMLLKKCSLANDEAFEYLGEDFSSRFHLRLKDKGFDKDFSVIGVLPFSPANLKGIEKNILFVNADYIEESDELGSFLFVKNPERDFDFIPGDRVDKIDMSPAYKKIKQQVNIVIFGVDIVLFLFGAMIVYYFVNHIYSKYDKLFRITLLYGKRSVFATAMLFGIFVLGVTSADALGKLLVSQINDIFYVYYVDFIGYEPDMLLIVVSVLVLSVASFFIERYLQTKLAKNYRGIRK